MNKKILSQILLVSTSMVSIGAFVVSCHVEPKKENETPTTPPTMTPTTPPTTPPKEKPLTPDERIKKELNDEANKVKIDYPKKDEILPSAASNSMFIFSGFDDKKYKILQDGVKSIDQGGISTVSFKIVDLKDEKKQSDLKEFNVSGFKKTPLTEEKLLEFAKKLELDYPNKSDVYPWDYVSSLLTIKNLPPYTKIVHSEIEEINPENSNAIVRFFLVDAFDPTISVLHTMEISGFKKITKDSSKLAKILLDDKKGFIKLINSSYSTFLLQQKLSKPNAEITINFNSNKILMRDLDRDIKLSIERHLEVVGELTPDYQNFYNELKSEVNELINKQLKILGISSTEEFTKLFMTNKREGKTLFTTLKEKLDMAASTNSQITFLTGYAETIEKLIDSDNFVLGYNPKTGMIAMQSGDAQIDFNNPKTFVNFIAFKDELKNDITTKIKESLTKNNVDSDIIDLFSNDKNHTLTFIIEKNGSNLLTGLRIKQNPSALEKPKN